MVVQKTLLFFLFIASGILILAHANAYEDEWRTELNREEFFTEDTLQRRRCPPKEHYDRCKASSEQYCDNYNEHPGVLTGDCEPGCVCNRGYVRGPDGRCIKPKRCPSASKCPPGEHFDRCSFSCQKNCSNWNETELTCRLDCLPGCVCDEGTIRSSSHDGKCIRPEECKAPEGKEEGLPIPFLCRKKNEEYSICPSLCPDNCTNYHDSKRACKIICLPLPQCVCKSGFIKGPDGDCIKPDQCQKDKKPEDCTELERYTTCGTSCEDTCDNYKERDRDCGTRCNVGCFCVPGYVRGPKGDCIYPFDCPAESLQIDFNDEIDDEEMDNLEYETHEEKESTRDPKYDKIPEESDDSETKLQEEKEESQPSNFPQTFFCKKNEVYSICPSLCPDNCTNYQDKTRACKIICLPLPGCVCKSGYVVGPDGTCIKVEKCHKDQKPDDCVENEYYDTCGSSCPADCKNYNSEDDTCDKKCNIGCFCRPGMVRGPNGKCIWPFECEVKPSNSEESENIQSSYGNNFCPTHEEYDPCDANLENDCGTRSRTTSRRQQPWCVAGCRCKREYVRGPEGVCIQSNECPDDDKTNYPVIRVCPKNEIWSPIAHCQVNCSDTMRRPCPMIHLPGCICQRGYMRNLEGMCIPEFQCPENPDNSEIQGVGITEDEYQSFGCPSQYACRSHCTSSGSRGGVCTGAGLRFCMCYH